MSIADDRRIDWYFDFISPFAYLQWQRLKRLTRYEFEYRPILFAGLLKQYGHKGPAEIVPKREFTYRHAQWRADRAGVRMNFPPAHPFNPLPALRLCVAAGCTAEAVDRIFDHIWRDGCASDVSALQPVAHRLGIPDPESALGDPVVKARLQENFESALAHGVFGVPTIVAKAQVFWGEDATEMFEAFMADPALFESPRMQRLASLPVGTARREVG